MKKLYTIALLSLAVVGLDAGTSFAWNLCGCHNSCYTYNVCCKVCCKDLNAFTPCCMSGCCQAPCHGYCCPPPCCPDQCCDDCCAKPGLWTRLHGLFCHPCCQTPCCETGCCTSGCCGSGCVDGSCGAPAAAPGVPSPKAEPAPQPKALPAATTIQPQAYMYPMQMPYGMMQPVSYQPAYYPAAYMPTGYYPQMMPAYGMPQMPAPAYWMGGR